MGILIGKLHKPSKKGNIYADNIYTIHNDHQNVGGYGWRVTLGRVCRCASRFVRACMDDVVYGEA